MASRPFMMLQGFDRGVATPPFKCKTEEKGNGKRRTAGWIGVATKLVPELSKFLPGPPGKTGRGGGKNKGDITDVLLMSLSMAVLIYISQQLVCVYCLLRSSL